MDNSPGEQIAKEAERLIERARVTGFARKPTIDRRKAIFRVDDGTFVALLVQSLPPRDFAQIPKRDHEQYPSAAEFHEFLAAGRRQGWERVGKLSEVRRGDVVAWKGSKNSKGSESGHVAVVAGTAEFDQEAKEWAVRVHEFELSRSLRDSRQGKSGFRPGPGSGELRFQVNSRGKPVAVKLGDHSDFHKRPIAIGRLVSQPRRTEPASKVPSANATAALAQLINRAAVASEVLGAGEFAVTTYALASTDGKLLPSTTLAFWGPGQKVPQSVGNGATTYSLAGGVVFRNP